MSTNNEPHVSFKAPLMMIGALLAGLVFIQPALADNQLDQADVELLVLRVAWGAQSQGNAEAYLGQNLTQEFYRVKFNGESGLHRLPAIAPDIDDDDLRKVTLRYLHVAVFGLTAIATASVQDKDGNDQTFAIMCVEKPGGWKIAALVAR
jgi:hypothetical protein